VEAQTAKCGCAGGGEKAESRVAGGKRGVREARLLRVRCMITESADERACYAIYPSSYHYVLPDAHARR